jgi:hypothetical protein
MTRKPMFWLGSLALLATLTLMALPVQAANRSDRTAEVSARVDPAKYLPDDTIFYMSVSLKPILESKLLPKDAIAKAKEALKNEKEAQQYLSLLGLDPFKDFDSVTLAGTSLTVKEKVFGIVTGRFNVEKFQKVGEKLAKEKAEVVKLKQNGAYKVWEITPPNNPTAIFAVMVDKSTILFTPDEDLLKEGLAKHAGKKKAALQKDISAYLKQVPEKTGFSFLLLGSAFANVPFPLPDQAKAILEKITAISADAQVADEIKIQLAVKTKDKDSAKSIGENAQLALGQAPNLIDLMINNVPKLVPLKDVIKQFVADIKVSTNDMSVTFKAVITKEMIDVIKKELKKDD